MPEAGATDRLLPCLLDRLTDPTPGAKTESADRRTISMRQYREGVRRDLEYLLNARCRTADDPVGLFARVATSVLNFGVPDMTGQTLSGLNILDLERKIRQAIIEYEPRVLAEGLSVRLASSDEAAKGRHRLTLEIVGQLWATPMPDPLYYRTDVDLETGQFEIKDRSHG